MADSEAMQTSRPVELLCRYLRIDTTQPYPDYPAAVEFWEGIAHHNEFHTERLEPVPGKPMLLVTYGPSGQSDGILLSSHMDVVPFTQEKWHGDPLSGAITQDGYIYGRGSQDMKCVGVAYMEVLLRLRDAGIKVKRPIHALFTVDEEIGSADGMKLITGHLKDKLRISLALDEGVVSPHSKLYVFDRERPILQTRIHVTGNAGHGSAPIQGTAMEKVSLILQRIYAFRQEQVRRLTSIEKLGCITMVNVNMIQGGRQHNVIPDSVELTADIRVDHGLGLEGIKAVIDGWIDGFEGVFVEYDEEALGWEATMHGEPYAVLDKVLRGRNIDYSIECFPGGTDSRFLRHAGIPVISMTPIKNTPVLMHDHDERVAISEFLAAIDIYEDLIRELANMP